MRRTPRERVLAWASATTGERVAGTRDALLITDDAGETRRIPWEEVEAADWDAEESRLRVSEVGTWGEQRVEHTLTLEEPRRLLELVRERVTASVVLQRHVPIEGRRGLRVIARRAPRGDSPIAWFYEYDAGIDPVDPAVHAAATEALEAMRSEVGDR